LFPDETYYWEWSRHLALGYYDHPPAIAWLIRAGTSIAGDTSFGVRLFPVLAGTLASLFIALSARRLADERAALTTAIIFAVMPLSAAGLVLATPDAPLFAAISAIFYTLVRVLENEPRSGESLRWWCVAGVALGLAFWSKYSSALVPAAVLISCLSDRELRRRLTEPGPYVAVAIALVLFAPVIVWNARHDWISFTFQLRHGLGFVGGSVIRRELELIAGQAGLVTPILFVMLVVAVARHIRERPTRTISLAVTALIVFAFFMYSATKRRVEANWPALFYVPALLVMVTHGGTARWRRWLQWGIAFAAIVTAAAYVNSFTPILPIPAHRDPIARAAGWDDLAKAVDRVYAPRLPISSYRTHVAADRYQEAGELAFHLPDQPRAFSLNLSTRPNQYDFWPGFPQRAYPRDGLILVLDEVAGDHPTIAMLTPHFERITRGERVVLARNGDPVKELRIWVLDRWLGSWPKATVRSRP
jgi:4-amino-4-deoxy-L-arabinose transferase-like glycosyltransferase